MIVGRAQLTFSSRTSTTSFESRSLLFLPLSVLKSDEEKSNREKNKSAQRNNKTTFTQNYVRMSWTVYLSRLGSYVGGIWRRMFHSENTSNAFPPHYAGQFGFAFQENSFKEITQLSWCLCYREASFSKYFPSALKHNAGAFKFLRFEARFRKAPLVRKAGLTAKNKAASSNSSGVELTRP